MSLEGPLDTVDFPQLVELARGMNGPTRIVLETPSGQWQIFVAQGQVTHAEGPGSAVDEEALVGALQARAGSFRLETGVMTPQVTITRPWNAVLLDILRRLDEVTALDEQEPPLVEKEVVSMAKPKKIREQVADELAELLDESVDIIGAAAVGTDGLIYSATFPRRGADANLIAASAAAVYGLSQRTLKQLEEGKFSQTLIEGSDGYLLVRGVTPRVIFVGVLAKDANLGMAFAEARTITAKLAGILQGLG